MTEVITEVPIQVSYQSRQSKYYNNKRNTDLEFKQKEQERVRNMLKSRYENDPEYRKHKKEQSQRNYYNKKALQKNFN